ncbi:hypothetical protein [Mycolicibacterium tusciae]|uniref:Heavy metal-binding domain-containing protein n=1 Tax=Mycolicibacterium tusciae TaxID=75922 RepID=A0A1X0JIX7_9MYCO|nr:hypothetical protein [Mycolicibacterium tusciae]ORB62784.1 hypothetical protein BST47_22600 [Mycolicibacterium tusciae]
MNTSMKLGGFAVVLAAVFGGAVAVGNATGSWVPRTESVEHDVHGATSTTPVGPPAVSGAADDPVVSGGSEPAATLADTSPTGLRATDGGYTFLPEATSLPSGKNVGVTFRIMGPDGRPVTKYEMTHDKDLHLIAVRRDMTGFQHVHPTLEASGVWHTHLDLLPGPWRLFADFKPAGADDLTLGTDVSVTGDYHRQPLAPSSMTTTVDDYTVTLTGDLSAGSSSKLTLSVSRGGAPVTDLQPYLAAYGHLVVLRSDDLAYLHVHPEGTPGDGVTEPGPDVTFYATTPSTGPYRMFLDFQHDGVVRTAEFTATAADFSQGPAEATPPPAPAGTEPGGHH